MTKRIPKMPIIVIASCWVVMLILDFLGKVKFDDLRFLENSEFAPREIEAYSEGINSISYNENGSISYTLRADNQIHYKDGDTKIEKPMIRLFQDSIPRWNIIANEGQVLPVLLNKSKQLEEKNLTLSGNVEIWV